MVVCPPICEICDIKLDHVPPKISGQTYKIHIKRWKKTTHHPKSLIKNVPRIPFTDGRFGAWLSMTHWKGKCCCQPPSWTEPDGILPWWKDAVSQHRGRPCLVFALLAASPPKPPPPIQKEGANIWGVIIFIISQLLVPKNKAPYWNLSFWWG